MEDNEFTASNIPATPGTYSMGIRQREKVLIYNEAYSRIREREFRFEDTARNEFQL
jgi:hypothetical protein